LLFCVYLGGVFFGTEGSYARSIYRVGFFKETLHVEPTGKFSLQAALNPILIDRDWVRHIGDSVQEVEGVVVKLRKEFRETNNAVIGYLIVTESYVDSLNISSQEASRGYNDSMRLIRELRVLE
jgi:hypothetical protein